MKLFHVHAGACLAAALFVSGSLALWAAEGAAPVTWYTGGAASVQLAPVSASVDFRLELSGTTKMKSLMLKLAKSGSFGRQLTIPVNPDGSFHAVILLKEGPGSYAATLFGAAQASALSFAGIGRFSVESTTPVPADLPGLYLNDKVLAYVDSVMGQTVDRGECWDLAQEALDRNGADWTRPMVYGQALDPARDQIQPGDIIQFRSVKTETKLPGGGRQWESYGSPDHTAIVYTVLGDKHWRLAHQNLGGKRFVQVTEVNLNNLTSGQYWIYRPVAAMFFP